MLQRTLLKPYKVKIPNQLDDVNKSKRTSMWWIFAISLISIPAFHIFDNEKLTHDDLLTINNLILLKDAQHDPGGGKSSTPSIKLSFTTTDRRFILTSEEYQCVSNDIILANFKKGDTVAIKIKKSDKDKFSRSNWFSKNTKLFGLTKKGKSYLSLDCRNSVSDKRTNAATKASIASAALSLFFAIFILRPKTKYQALGQFPIDPILVVLVVWLVICITLR